MCVTKSSLPRPVVKWAGGKRQLLGELAERCPGDFGNYFEPFFGGGALYLYLWRTGAIQGKAFLNDANPELINLYRMIRDRTAELGDAMRNPAFVNTREAYLACRTRFNAIRGTEECVERAALFLYLNHHGYNGLWRVNQKGEYNCPFGSHTNPPRFWDANTLPAFADGLIPAGRLAVDFSGLLPQFAKGVVV